MAESQTIIAQAVELLKKGELVSFPTETVYGLGADAANPAALARLYEAKGRPASHPVIVHIGAIDRLGDWAADVSADALKLAKHFWPGPMTVILPKKDGVLAQVTGGQSSVALRMPNHPLALELLNAFGGGLAAPSANKFGKLSPTSAKDVIDAFGVEVSLVLDGGQCQVGIESTIVDLSKDQPTILRPGMISRTDIEAIIGSVLWKTAAKTADEITNADGVTSSETYPGKHGGDQISVEETRAPGTLPSHYSPNTPLYLVPAGKLGPVLASWQSAGLKLAVLAFAGRQGRANHCPWTVASSDPDAYAQQLYGNLRDLDSSGCDRIVVETVPEDARWQGIEDRLVRAAHTCVSGAEK